MSAVCLPGACGVAIMASDAGTILLIQFARLPRIGAVKTRLIPALGAEGACAVHEGLLEWSCQQLLSADIGPVELWLDEAGVHPLLARLEQAGVSSLRTQAGGDLGQRMYEALLDGLSRYDRVLLVGSDCPQLDASYLRAASQALHSYDCVLGPASDGGYVLIGASRISRACFRAVDWGTAQVFEQSLQRMAAAGLSCYSLEPRSDIDRPQDLGLWEALQAGLRR